MRHLWRFSRFQQQGAVLLLRCTADQIALGPPTSMKTRAGRQRANRLFVKAGLELGLRECSHGDGLQDQRATAAQVAVAEVWEHIPREVLDGPQNKEFIVWLLLAAARRAEEYLL